MLEIALRFLFQIRASALSGECSWSHELLRGHIKLAGGQLDCVKRFMFDIYDEIDFMCM